MKSDNKWIYEVLLLVFLILAISSGIRYFNNDPLFSFGEFYDDLRISHDLSEGNHYDVLQSRNHSISLTHYLLSLISSFSHEAMVLLAAVLGLASLFLFFKLTSIFIIDKRTNIFLTLLFGVSPAFIYLFTRLNELTIATFLSFLFAYLFLKKNNWSIIVLVLLSTASFSFLIITLLLASIYLFYRMKQKQLLTLLIPPIISFITFAFFHTGFLNNFFSDISFTSFFTEFGAMIGIPFFYLFLGIIGFFKSWRRRIDFSYLLLSIIVILVISLFNPAGRIFLTAYASIFAGILLNFLIDRRWEIIIIKKFTLLLVLCVVLFSTISYIDMTANSEPMNELENALIFLKSQSDGTVFSTQNNGFLISYFSDKKVFLDDNSIHAKNYDSLRQDETSIFYSRNLETTSTLLTDNSIHYILITPVMKQGAVWRKPTDGLLFLLENSDAFTSIYFEDNIEIWEFNKWNQ